MSIHYQDELVTLYHGDCRDVLPTLPEASVDAIVTDPPYDLTAGKKGGTGQASVNLNTPHGRSRIGTGNGGGFMGQDWDATGVAFDPATWREALRVLKPGGHLLAFGGTRTFHRLTCAIEDAGFEIRDCLSFMYASGFPKSHDASKAIDKAAGAERKVVGTKHVTRIIDPDTLHKHNYTVGVTAHGGDIPVTAPATPEAERWQGWGTALKPAWEPIILARKPLAGTVAATVLEYGTGALNIDGCRVAATDPLVHPAVIRTDNAVLVHGLGAGVQDEPSGRWPANVVLDREAAAMLDAQSGVSRDGATSGKNGGFRVDGYVGGPPGRSQYSPPPQGYGGEGGASRFFKVVEDDSPALPIDEPGSRFMYTAKAGRDERPSHNGVKHPTVKPLDLMRWLVRLVTPPGGTVLDMFAGSGTTAEAAVIEGFHCIAVEQHAPYLPLIVQRLEVVEQTLL